jgi:hypothetical protein
MMIVGLVVLVVVDIPARMKMVQLFEDRRTTRNSVRPSSGSQNAPAGRRGIIITRPLRAVCADPTAPRRRRLLRSGGMGWLLLLFVVAAALFDWTEEEMNARAKLCHTEEKNPMRDFWGHARPGRIRWGGLRSGCTSSPSVERLTLVFAVFKGLAFALQHLHVGRIT